MSSATSLAAIHLQIKQERQLTVMLDDDIARQRDSIICTIKDLISNLRDFCLLDTWYPRINDSNLVNFLESPIGKRTNDTIYESTSTLPFQLSLSRGISLLLKDIYNYIPILTQCIDLYFQKTYPPYPYQPCQTSIAFLASSTLPALFGYCWCLEQGAAYVEVICSLILLQLKRTKSVNSSDFRNSYLREIIRQFMHFIGVQRYLQLSMSNIIFKFFYDDELDSLDRTKPEYYERLIGYAELVTNGLIRALPSAPPLLRLLLKRGYEVVKECYGEESGEPFALVRILFLDLLILPALLNPAQFALLTDTSVDPKSPHTAPLMLVTTWAVDPATITSKGHEMKITQIEKFKQLKTRKLIENLCHYDEPIQGIFSAPIQKLTNCQYHLLKISVNDLFFLSHIVENTINSVEYDQIQCGKFYTITKIDLPDILDSTELIDFWYQSYKLPDQPLKADTEEIFSGFNLPLFSSSQIQAPKDDLTTIIQLFIFYLESLQPLRDAPTDVFDFLKKMKEIATENENPQLITRTEAMLTKLKSTKLSSEAILERLQLVVNSHLSDHSKLLTKSFRHQMISDQTTKACKSITQLNQQLTPIVDQAFIMLFLRKTPSIKDSIETNLQAICTKTDAWIDMFKGISEQLKAFTVQMNFDQSRMTQLHRQLHSALMGMVKYSKFEQFNLKLPKLDKKIKNRSHKILKHFLEDDFSPVLKRLFASPSTFSSALQLLKDGISIGSPLERLEKIDSTTVTLHDIYAFEAGEGCSGDDFVPLFIYTLLSAKLPNLASVMRYLEHFLLSLDETVEILSSKEKYVATTFISSAKHVLGEAKKRKEKSHPFSLTN